MAPDQPPEALKPLTPTEMVIWQELRRFEGRTVTNEALTSRVLPLRRRDETGCSIAELRLYILKIRRKLAPSVTILNEWGRGYKLVRRQAEAV